MSDITPKAIFSKECFPEHIVTNSHYNKWQKKFNQTRVILSELLGLLQ